MKKLIVTGALSLFFILSSGAAFSQCKEVVWPEDGTMKAKAEESKVLYEDAIKLGTPEALKSAIGPFNWMLKNIPNHHVSLYIQGIELYDKLATQEKNAARKAVLVDSLMIIYDLRVKQCGDEANVINRKALSYLKHMANAKPAETLQLLDKAFELSGNNILDGTLLPYMQVVRLNHQNLKNMTDDQVIERYDRLVGVVDAKIQALRSKGGNVDKLNKTKSDIEDVFTATVTINCDIVRKNFAPKFEKNPNDLEIARKIFTFMLKDKCTDDPLWLKAAETVHRLDTTKNCGLAKNLGIIYISKDDFVKGEQYLKEAQTICDDKSDKSDILMYLGAIEAKRGQRSSARDLYRQAAQLNPEVAKQVYERIGDLYIGSFDACKELRSKVEDRAVFLLAFDYYQRAGDSRKMATAKENFPSKEEIFTENVANGSSISVKCWIGESTTVRTRD